MSIDKSHSNVNDGSFHLSCYMLFVTDFYVHR